MTKRMYFGEDVLLSESYKRDYGATALSYVDVLLLERHALHRVLQGGSSRWPNMWVSVNTSVDCQSGPQAVHPSHDSDDHTCRGSLVLSSTAKLLLESIVDVQRRVCSTKLRVALCVSLNQYKAAMNALGQPTSYVRVSLSETT